MDKEPNIVLIEGYKGGKSRLTVEKPLIVYQREGVYTDEIYEIMKSIRDNTDIAKQTLKAFETAKKHRAPLPQNVVITDCMHVADGENLFSNDTILLAPKAKNYSNGFVASTAEYHFPLPIFA